MAVLAAVKHCRRSQIRSVLECVDVSLKDDLEIKIVTARNMSATAGLKVVRQLSKVPDWESKDTELKCAVELLAAFPNSSWRPKVNSQLHNLVEQMIKRAYRPGMKRDRVAFENDFAE